MNGKFRKLSSLFLVVLPALLQILCFGFCSTLWQPRPMRLPDLDISWSCWLYCNALGQHTAVLPWEGIVAGGIVSLLLSAFFLVRSKRRLGIVLAVFGGVLLFPIGILAGIGAILFPHQKRKTCSSVR